MRRYITLAALALGACVRPGPSVASAGETELVQQVCEKAFACSAEWDTNEHMQNFNTAYTGSTQGCENKLGLSSADLGVLDEAVSMGRVIYNAQALGECLDHNTGVACYDWFHYAGEGRLAECPAAFTGTVPLGTPCTLSFECSSQQCSAFTHACV